MTISCNDLKLTGRATKDYQVVLTLDEAREVGGGLPTPYFLKAEKCVMVVTAEPARRLIRPKRSPQGVATSGSRAPAGRSRGFEEAGEHHGADCANDTPPSRPLMLPSGADNYLPSSLANPNNVPVAINFPSALTI